MNSDRGDHDESMYMLQQDLGAVLAWIISWKGDFQQIFPLCTKYNENPSENDQTCLAVIFCHVC